MLESSQLPAPRDAFLAVLNHLTLRLLAGHVEVAAFDQAVNALIAATDVDLQAELVQVKLLAKRLLAVQTKPDLTKQLTRG